MHWILLTNRIGDKIPVNLEQYRLMERSRLDDNRPCTMLLAAGLAAKVTGEVIDANLVVMETPEEILAAPLIKKGQIISKDPEPFAPPDRLLGVDQLVRNNAIEIDPRNGPEFV